MGGEHENNHTAAVDGINDRFAPVHARNDISRRDRAPDPLSFKGSTDSGGSLFIMCRIADEHIMRHTRSFLQTHSGDALIFSLPFYSLRAHIAGDELITPLNDRDKVSGYEGAVLYV